MNVRSTFAALTLGAAVLPMTANAINPWNHERPLDACSAAIHHEFKRAEVTDTFHRRLDDGQHEIYANVVAPAADGAKHHRVTCRTSTTGIRVLELSSASGRWVEPKRG